MKELLKSGTLATGLAMFAMFFGAGNIIFPLTLGQFSGAQNGYAILGMLFTAVLMPIVGLMSVILFQGNYKKFFYRTGKLPGTIFILLSLVLIGPLFGIPRSITLAYGIFEHIFGNISLFWFAFIACALIFLCTISKNKLIDIIAYLLTPILLLFLGIIIVQGIITKPDDIYTTQLTNLQLFFHGLIEGYNTLDVLAAFFFSTLIIWRIRQKAPDHQERNNRYMIIKTLQASIIGGGLLALVYTGMSFTTAFYSQHEILGNTEPDYLIAAVSLLFLGKHAGIIAALAAALACLTTAISLTVIFAEFLREDIFQGKKKTYIPSLILTLVISFVLSLHGFSGIVAIVIPIIVLVYPAFIMLSLCNIAYKLFLFRWVKLPVALTLAASVAFRIMSN